MGTVPVRAPMGNRPRRLQRGRRRLEPLQPRPGAPARVSLGGGRLRGNRRRQAAPLLRAGALDRMDSILKERLFGLANNEGNHGEDVKEYYYYLDSTPTHSYMKYLYRYPQAAYPYDDLVETNRHRSRQDVEYELIDTGVFDEDRYFDGFVEYSKAEQGDILIRITICNRGTDAAPLHLLPTVWFRNTWSWKPGEPKPRLQAASAAAGFSTIGASHQELGE